VLLLLVVLLLQMLLVLLQQLVLLLRLILNFQVKGLKGEIYKGLIRKKYNVYFF